MGLYQTKFWFRSTFAGWTKYFIKVDPDLLSYLAVLVSAVTGVCLFYFPYHVNLLLVAFALILLRMALNTFDGMIAIAQNKKTMIGEIVNALPDRYSDIVLLLGLAWCPATNAVLGTGAIVSVLLVSYTGMLGKAVAVDWQHQGPVGKVDRLVVLLAAILVQYLVIVKGVALPGLSGRPGAVFDLVFVWFILGSQLTIYNRLKGMTGEISAKERGPVRINGLVVYDSRTGNTEKVARHLGTSLGLEVFRVDQAPLDLAAYDILFLGTLNIRARPTPRITDYLNKVHPPSRCALFVTYGMPLWGPLSSRKILGDMARHLKSKGSVCVAKFQCPGYHVKYKFYPGRPNQRDLKRAPGAQAVIRRGRAGRLLG